MTVRELWGEIPKHDPYLEWFKANRDRLEVFEIHPFGASAVVSRVDEFEIRRCENGHLYANPRLTTAAAKQFFDFNMAAYFEIVHATNAQRMETSYQPMAHELCALFPNKGKVLEVGCGTGALMRVLTTAGFETEGCEISSAAAPYHGDLRVFEGAIEDRPGRDVFDIVLMWSVADHFADPAVAFSACRRLLKPGGKLYISNINVDGFDIATLGSDSPVFTPPGRVNFYSLLSMRSELERAGFEIEKQFTRGELDCEIVRNYWADGGLNGKTAFFEDMLANENFAEDFQNILNNHNMTGFQSVLATRAKF